ncbi:hypothetical protein LOZ12_000142 [Ophidiomyces ophidiicola]|uniref:Uncharacterized protein n=1 Tax=Ophidiomyces ophidiicola TaxID=1387563 RepID=A0ACB8V5H7_9EURO|nr:hypothetical protein LOZ64_000942 [Ophidiomyces ophidiicola]KAI1956065.1 hypothetical protein LOZ62_000057 [Ophidiomyces ophidiicola]KAI1967748.1 hypothetical protein LOZ59_000563 [Ophidiomyces ophidiicola]KAI2007076.1 hypothetical protein LOZ50_002736 [Ophidiomyces ophidiicola]KAI2034048.1 hypothetical protein LOZ45_000669 [Ophidiomyces ophidiicola]
MGHQALNELGLTPYLLKMKESLEKSGIKPFNVLMFLGLIFMIAYRKWADSVSSPKLEGCFGESSKAYMKTRTKRVQKLRRENASKFPNITPLENFEWEKTEPLKFRPFKPKYHLTMALENLEPSELIPMDNTYKDRIELRRQLVKDQYGVVLGVNKSKGGEEEPRVRAAVAELYAFVMGTYLPTRYPTMFRLLEADLAMGKTMFVQNQVTREMLPTTLNPGRPTISALETLAKNVDEEMLLLLPRVKNPEKKSQDITTSSTNEVDKYILEAYSTCFPSGFDTRTKLGRQLNEIHQPVPGYKEKLEKSMDRFFHKLEVGKFVKRVNWTMTTGAELFSAFGDVHAVNGEDMKQMNLEELDIDKTYLRCERQTLYRLPTSGALIFSFHTYRYPIREIKAEGSGEELALAIDGFKEGSTPLMARYKRVTAWGEAVKEYLRS